MLIKKVHSLHGYFLHPGSHAGAGWVYSRGDKAGQEFWCAKRLRQLKDRGPFLMSASFTCLKAGIEHQAAMPNIVAPSQLQPFSKIFCWFCRKIWHPGKGILSSDGPFVFHPLEYYDPFNPGIRPPRQHLWFKPNGTVLYNQTWMQNWWFTSLISILLITSLLPHNLSFSQRHLR